MLRLLTKLHAIQQEFHAPKDQPVAGTQSRYRSLDGIIEALKPLLEKNKCVVLFTDTIELIGDRYYLKATVRFVDIETGEEITANGYAREAETEGGKSASQLTGGCSTYARRYAICALLAADDTKTKAIVDPDSAGMTVDTRTGEIISNHVIENPEPKPIEPAAKTADTIERKTLKRGGTKWNQKVLKAAKWPKGNEELLDFILRTWDVSLPDASELMQASGRGDKWVTSGDAMLNFIKERFPQASEKEITDFLITNSKK